MDAADLRREVRPADPHGAGYLVRLDGRDQSHVDLADPTRLVFDYVRRLGDVIDAWGRPRAPVRAVHVGGGGLTLPRYLSATRPRSSQVVLEPDEALTSLVRRELPLPVRSGIKVRATGGRRGLRDVAAARTDLVVLDAFAAGRLPPELSTREWFADVARVLTPGGWLLANLADRAPWWHTRRVLAGVRGVLPEVLVAAEPSTLKGRRSGNLLVVASRGAVPLAALRGSSTRGSLPYRVVAPAAVRDTLGGGAPFTDAEVVPGSP